jgi:aminoglycoside 2'-N-acetyltransferase I
MLNGASVKPHGLRIVPSDELTNDDTAAMRALFEAAWPPGWFDEHDWDHMFPGLHFLLDVDGEIASHGCVVSREIHAAGQELRTGYVENVATWPARQGRGHATALMRAIDEHVLGGYELGCLDTGVGGFYERLGWRRWRGPTFVRTDRGPIRTEEEDGGVFVLPTPASPELDLSGPISCPWRPGDVW